MNKREQCNADVILRSQIQAGIDHQKSIDSIEVNDIIAAKDAELAARDQRIGDFRAYLVQKIADINIAADACREQGYEAMADRKSYGASYVGDVLKKFNSLYPEVTP